MAAPVAPPDGDPFPLLHLADLDFALTQATLADLAAYQLALAPWSTNWDDSMAAALKRTWRRRREKARPLITAREPMGIYAPLELQQRELFPRFECVDLAFELDPTNDDLDHLSSAQLAAVQFHPAATKDLVMAAEDVFFTRRERDFAAGLSLPPFPPSASTSYTSSAPAPVSAAPAPLSVPHAPTPTATSPATSTLAPLPARAPTVSRLPPRTAAPPSLPAAPPTSMGAPPRAADVAAPAAPSFAASSSASSSSSRIPAFARPPAPAPAPALVAQPQQSSSSSASTSGSRVPASASSARDGAALAGERERERDRARDEDSRRDRDRDREHGARRERSRDRDYDVSRSHDRASSSRRSERERERERSLSPGTAQRERERAAYKAAKAARAREDEGRERERDERRRRAGEVEREDRRSTRERSPRRSSGADEPGARAERDREEREGRRDRDERERDSGSKPSSSKAYSRARSRSRSPASRRDSGHETSVATPSSRKRAVSPARSDYSHASSSALRSSTRRRLDDADQVSAPAPASTPPMGPRRQTPPPDRPQAFESVPMELLSRLHTVFLRHFPGRLSPTDVADYVRQIQRASSMLRADPVAIKCHSKPNQDFGLAGANGLERDVTLAFVMYDEGDIESARELIQCTDGSRYRDRKIMSSKGTEQTKSTWRWSDFNPAFVEAHYRRQLAAHAARHAPPAHADARSAAVMTSFLADRAPPHDVAAAPHASTSASASAGPSAETGRAGRRASTVPAQAPPRVALPPHLHGNLPTLYVSNVAADTDLGECRDFFDPCEGLVGLSLDGVVSSTRALRFRDAWLAFETHKEREQARQALMRGRYPGAAVKLWVENAELRAQKQGEQHEWLWSEMSKDYRSRHLSEYEMACRSAGGDAARTGSDPRSDYPTSNSPTRRLQQQQAQAYPTLDPRRRPSQQSSTTSLTAAPTTLRFFPAAHPLPPSSIVDPFMSASSSSSISNGPPAPSSRLPAPAQAPPPPDAYSPLAAALPFDTFSTSHPPHPHAYSASHQQQQSSSAPATRPSTVVPRPGPQAVFGSGSSACPPDSALMRPPSAPAAPLSLSAPPPPPPPSAPRGVGYMDPARAALLASAGAGASTASGDALVDEPMQLDDDDDEPIAVGHGQSTAAEEAARSAWGARRGGAAAVGAQVQQDGAQQQENGSQQFGANGRPRSLSLGIKGLAGSFAAGTSAGTRSPAATPSTALEPSPAPAPTPATPAPAADTPAPAVTAAEAAPSISASALEALGEALKLQGLPALGSTVTGAEEGAGETP